MISTLEKPLRRTDPRKRTAPVGYGRPLQQGQRSDRPLLDWIAGELQQTQGIDRSRALHQAGRILEQAFAAVA